MKKILTIAAVLLGAMTYAQVKDQFTLMGEPGLEMVWYEPHSDGEGFTVGSKYYMEIDTNEFNKPSDFNQRYVNGDNIKARGATVPNHYTKPSFFYYESSIDPGVPEDEGVFYLLVDGVFYQIEGMYDEIKPGGDYKIMPRELYYVIGSAKEKDAKDEAEPEEGKKKKKKFGAKLMNKLNESMESMAGVTIPKSILERDHKAVIDAYLAEMEKVQAANPYTAEEEKELAAIFDKKLAFAGKANAANAEYQTMMNSKGLLINRTGKEISISAHFIDRETKEIYKAVFHVAHGSSLGINCKEDAYIVKVQGKPVDRKLIYTKNTSCRGEKTIRVIP